MAIYIEKILDVYTIDAIVAVLQQDNIFVDGKLTSGQTAKKVKDNLQANPDNAEVKGAIKLIEQALLSHPEFINAALPVKLAKLMFNRYEQNMHYGPHIDEPFIQGVRTDLSFTLFLSEPDSYDGGELVIKRQDGDESIKLAKGALYLYPSTTIHHVTPVTKGTRLALVGWVQSQVRRADQREILYNLVSALNQLPQSDDNAPARLQLLQAQNHLKRLWFEGESDF